MAVPLLLAAQQPRSVSLWLNGGVALLTGLSIAVVALRVPDTAAGAGRGRPTAVQAVKDVVRNRHGWRLLSVFFIDNFGLAVMAALVPCSESRPTPPAPGPR